MDTIIEGGFIQDDDLVKEYRKRKKNTITKRVLKGEKIGDDWEIIKEYQTTFHIKRDKKVSEMLEDKVWQLFYEMGMDKISEKRLVLLLKEKPEKGVKKTKQIDVIAGDEDVVFYVECKSKTTKGKLDTLKKELSEFIQNRDLINKALKPIFPSHQFVPIFATENIDWGPTIYDDAVESNIVILTENEIGQLLKLSKLAGEGAKYQIYNKIFHGKKIRNFSLKIPAIKSKMGGKTYYTFSIEPEHLLKMAYVHQRSSGSFIEISESYQRIIKPHRQNAIKNFIEKGGFFPGNIIINFNKEIKNEEKIGTHHQIKECSTSNSQPVLITLPPYYGCAWIIDGQHRLYAFSDTDKKNIETVTVVAFIQEDVSTQAKMFIDINQNQKSINANLRWDLYEDLYINSTDEKEKELYSISKLVKMLNKTDPFNGSIIIPKEVEGGHITLTNFCVHLQRNGLLKSGNPFDMGDVEKNIEILYSRLKTYFIMVRKSTARIRMFRTPNSIWHKI